MSIITFRGDAVDIAQVVDIPVSGTFLQGDTLTGTINTKSFTVTLGSAVTIDDVINAFVWAWNGTGTQPTGATTNVFGSAIPEMAGISASNGTNKVILTANTPGEPFTVTVSNTGSGTFGPPGTVTTNNGRSSLSKENMSGGALPGALDDFVLENTSTNLLWTLDALTSLQSLTIRGSHTGFVGLDQNSDTAPEFREYRPRYLAVTAPTVTIDGASGSGSRRICLDLGATASSVSAGVSANSSNALFRSIRLLCNNAGTNLKLSGSAQLDLAPGDEETAVCGDVVLAGSAQFRSNPGCTTGNVNATAAAQADLYVPSGSTLASVNLKDTALGTLRGGGDFTTIEALGGSTLSLIAAGSITTLTLGPRATLDATLLQAAVTIATINAQEGATIDDPGGLLSITNPINLNKGNLENFNFNFGDGRQISVT